LTELGDLSDEKAVVRVTHAAKPSAKPCRPESGSSQNKDQIIEQVNSSPDSETLSQELERNEYLMNRLKLYNKFRGTEVKSNDKTKSVSQSIDRKSKESSSHDLAKR
jgi:hypothetical protein